MLRYNLLQERDLPVVTETINDIHPDIVIERVPLTPGVLNDDLSGSVSVLGLQNFQQAPAGRQNKKVARVKKPKTYQ